MTDISYPDVSKLDLLAEKGASTHSLLERQIAQMFGDASTKNIIVLLECVCLVDIYALFFFFVLFLFVVVAVKA